MVNINLLPPGIKEKVKQSKKSANIFSICLVVVIIFIVLSVLLQTTINQLIKPNLEQAQKDYEIANSSLKNLSGLEDKAVFLNDRARLAGQIESQKAAWSQILQDLVNSVPVDVQLVSINTDISKSPNFILQGTTSSEREIVKFKEKLENSKFFKDVAFKSSTTTTTDKGNSTNLTFSLEFNIEQKSVAASEKELK